MFNYNIIGLILLMLFISISCVSATDTLNDTENNIFPQDIDSNPIDNMSIDDEDVNINCDEIVESEYLNKSTDHDFDDKDIEDEVDYFYDEVIFNDTLYYNFLNHLINDCNFHLDINNSDIENNEYILVSDNDNYSFKLYSGQIYNLSKGDTYLASFNREGCDINGIYYPDLLYFKNNITYIDEDYLSWLYWTKNLKPTPIQINSTITNLTFNNIDLSITDTTNLKNAPPSNYPSYYNLAEHGYVTPFKPQIHEDCWAFATISSLESYLLKYENKQYNLSSLIPDFSENHLKNVMSSRGINGSPLFKRGLLIWGASYLTRWSGPIWEHDDEYGKGTMNYSYEYFSPIKHVQDILFIPGRLNALDNDKIKDAILNYGAVATNMKMINISAGLKYYAITHYAVDSNNNVYNLTFENYYSNNTDIGGGHDVTIIGWNDTYSKDKFNIHPRGDGAFIVKDSNWPFYWYVSYYDLTIALPDEYGIGAMAFVNVENVTNYKNIYQHDQVITGFYSIDSDEAIISNEFTARDNENISAIGFYNLQELNCKINILVNNNPAYKDSYNNILPGYHTMRLKNNVSIKKGDIFEIKILFKSADKTNKISIPVDAKTKGQNKSFFYNNYGKSLCEFNFCIKAYSGFSGNAYEPHIDSSNKIINVNPNSNCLIGYLKSNNPIPNADIIIDFTDKLNNSHIIKTINIKTDNNGGITIPISLNGGIYKAIIRFNGMKNYSSCSKSVMIKVKPTPVITLNKNTYFYGETATFTIKNNNNPLTNKKVEININGKSKSYTTNTKGQILIPLTVDKNKFDIKVNSKEDLSYAPCSKTFTINTKTTPATVKSKSNANKKLTVTLTNKKTGKIIPNCKLKLKIKVGNAYQKFYATTNNNGIATFSFPKISTGTYKAYIFSKKTLVTFTKVPVTIKVK